jgi:hypothetical protein
MDGQAHSVSSQKLYRHLGTASAPVLVDVRRQDGFDKDDRTSARCAGRDVTPVIPAKNRGAPVEKRKRLMLNARCVAHM